MSTVYRPFWAKSTCLVVPLLVAISANSLAAPVREPAPNVVTVPHVLSIVPDDLLAAQVIDNLQQANDRFKALAIRIGAPGADLLGMLKKVVGAELDEHGSMAIAQFPAKQPGDVWPVYFIPVKDFNAFLADHTANDAGDGIWSIKYGVSTALAVQQGKYAVVTDQGDKQLLQRVIASNDNLANSVSAYGLWRNNQDVGAIVTPQGIKSFVEAGVQGLEAIKAAIAAADAPNAAATANAMDMYKNLLIAFGKEVTYAGVGVQLDDKGSVHVAARAQFANDGDWAKLAAQSQPTNGDLLAGLPAGDFMMALGAKFNKSMTKAMMNFSVEMMKSAPQLYGELTDEQLEKMREGWRVFEDMKSMAMVFGAPQPGKPFMSKTFGLIRVADSQALLEQYEKMIQEYAKIMANAKNAPAIPKMKATKIEIASQPAIKVEMDMNMNLADNPGLPPGFKDLFGPGGVMTAYVTAIDKTTVAVAYSSEASLEKLLANGNERELAADVQIKKTRALLPAGPHGEFFLSGRGVVGMVQYFMALAPVPVPIEIPQFPEAPPLGIAVKMDRKGVTVEAAMPDDLIKAMGAFVGAVQAQMFQGRAGAL